MFIIVETIEEGEVNLCVVPESWEKNGILFWPPERKGMNLRKNDSILPDNNWSKQKCTVKKRNFTMFQAAVQAEKYLSQFNDTEDEENFFLLNSSRQTQRFQTKDNSQTDFNNLIMENNNIINNNVKLAKNVENPVNIIQVIDPTLESTSKKLGIIESTNAIIIESDETSTLLLNSFHEWLDNIQSSDIYVMLYKIL